MNSQAYADPLASSSSMRPLCVDLDGTLIKSDTLVDSLMLLVRAEPLTALKVPFWITKGKAALKERVTSIVSLDVVHLPYNRPLLAYLEEQHAAGRKIYLATGADVRIATRIADHLGFFAGVLSSDGRVNLTGHNKLASLRERFESGFDYVGNARPDLPLLAGASEPMVANPDMGPDVSAQGPEDNGIPYILRTANLRSRQYRRRCGHINGRKMFCS